MHFSKIISLFWQADSCACCQIMVSYLYIHQKHRIPSIPDSREANHVRRVRQKENNKTMKESEPQLELCTLSPPLCPILLNTPLSTSQMITATTPATSRRKPIQKAQQICVRVFFLLFCRASQESLQGRIISICMLVGFAGRRALRTRLLIASRLVSLRPCGLRRRSVSRTLGRVRRPWYDFCVSQLSCKRERSSIWIFMASYAPIAVENPGAS